MEKIGGEYQWPFEDAQDEVRGIWNQLKKAIYKELNQKLSAVTPNLPLIKTIDDISFEPDWFFLNDWVIVTNLQAHYNCQGRFDRNEVVESLQGRLYLCYMTMEIEPSLKFKLDVPAKKLTISVSKIREMLEEKEESTHDGTIFDALAFGKPLRKDGDSVLSDRDDRDLRSAYKALGYSKDEVSLMVHQAVTHESFEEGMDLGQVVRLGLGR